MAAYNKFNLTVDWLVKKNLDFSADTIKVMLTNTAPVATNSIYSDISAAELANGNGYTTGGATSALTVSNSSGTEKVVAANVSWTGGAGSMGPFRYVVVYDSTPASNKTLICWFDYGSAVTLAPGEVFTVQFDATNGLFQLA
jgi:hypothetical protein